MAVTFITKHPATSGNPVTAGDLEEFELAINDGGELYTKIGTNLTMLGNKLLITSNISDAGSGSERVKNIVTISQAAYNLLGSSVDADTVYLITA